MKVTNNIYNLLLNNVKAILVSTCSFITMRNLKQQPVYIKKSTFNPFEK